MKKIWMTAALAAAAVLITGCAGKNEDPEDGKKETLTVAMELAYPPFETKDAKGNPSGVSVDFMEASGSIS